MRGQATNLGGNVFKKRLNKNRHRAILLTKAGAYWIFEYLFAKADRSNISDDELADFVRLAKGYEQLTDAVVDDLLKRRLLEEIKDGEAKKLPE